MNKMIKYYAVRSITDYSSVGVDYDYLISQELSATELADAIREVKRAVATRLTDAWLEFPRRDLDIALNVNCDGLNRNEALAVCDRAGAEYVWGGPGRYDWNIWSLDVNE